MNRIDTSIEGYKYIGVNLSKEQFSDLFTINTMMRSDTGKDIPVHGVLLVLKCLGLLPAELLCEISNDKSDADIEEASQRKFGRTIYENKNKGDYNIWEKWKNFTQKNRKKN